MQLFVKNHTCNCAQYVYCTRSEHVYRSELDELLDRLGLKILQVQGDGHCLFRCLQHFIPKFDFREWRIRITNHVQVKADQDALHDWHVSRFNDLARERMGGRPVENFYQFIEGMRTSEWGYSDWIAEFSCIEQVQVLVVDPRGRLSMTRHRSVARVRKTFFMINQENDSGNSVYACTELVQYTHSVYCLCVDAFVYTTVHVFM